uniref:C-type lectin domain-containing protein n=1 Tax=Mola mola TaxID=94237 RepID=A0A3Q3X743_MOLML
CSCTLLSAANSQNCAKSYLHVPMRLYKSIQSKTKFYRLVAVSFGLLCILQVVLNISLRIHLYHYVQQGWMYFPTTLYYVSSSKNSWFAGRKDCQQRGADLVIINSKEEQNFTGQFHTNTWIGLSMSQNEKTWKWVDGTPLIHSYWKPGEPNNYNGINEDCVELQSRSLKKHWNDLFCGHSLFWICEKKIIF